MSTEDNNALVRCAIEEVWNQGNVALADELYAPYVRFQYHFSVNGNRLKAQRSYLIDMF
jgi:hypothetical protein